MVLEVAPKKEPKPISISVRLTKTAVDYLKKLAEAHNLSQADVIENLIREEWKVYSLKKQRN